MAAFINMLVNEAGRLPVCDFIADITADIEPYPNLQHMYYEKAQKDAKRVPKFVHTIVNERGLELDVDDAFVTSF